MREIKFKCVLSEYKETDTEDIEIQILGDVLNIDFHTNSIQVMFPDGNCEWYELDSIKLLEYTGLKDCNNIEIYEGYKLKVDYSNQIGDFCTTFAVVNDIRFIDLEIINAERIEVIGNIYENTELTIEK